MTPEQHFYRREYRVTCPCCQKKYVISEFDLEPAYDEATTALVEEGRRKADDEMIDAYEKDRLK